MCDLRDETKAERREQMFWRGGERWKGRLWQGAKLGILQTGDLSKRLTRAILRPPSLKSWAGSKCYLDSISRSITQNCLHPLGLPGDGRSSGSVHWFVKALLRILTWFQIFLSNFSFFSCSPFSPSPPFLSKMQWGRGVQHLSAVLLKGPWLTVWVRKTGIRTGPPRDVVSATPSAPRWIINIKRREPKAAICSD